MQRLYQTQARLSLGITSIISANGVNRLLFDIEVFTVYFRAIGEFFEFCRVSKKLILKNLPFQYLSMLQSTIRRV